MGSVAIVTLTRTASFRQAPFNVDEEIAFIDGLAAKGQIVAVGECGLDGFCE